MSFIDDMARAAYGRLEAQADINLMETVAKTKLLSFNADVKEQLEEDLRKNPLMFNGKPMKRAAKYTYLGTTLTENSVSDSVCESIKQKIGKVKHMIFEIKSVIEDCRNNVNGAFLTGLKIWEGAVVPYLFHASECWMEIPKESLTVLNNLQETLLRALLSTPTSTPKVAMYWEVGMYLAENRIIESKLLFYFHLANLSQDSLASLILTEQRKKKIPSLTQEVVRYLAMINMKETDLKTFTKGEFKRRVRLQMKEKNRQDLLSWMKTYKKVDYFAHKDEKFGMKTNFETMNLHQCRMMFSLKAESVRTVKTHQMSDRNFEEDDWSCKCGKLDSLSHIIRCPEYSHLRESKDLLTNEEHLVKYFQDVIKSRDEAESAETRPSL